MNPLEIKVVVGSLRLEKHFVVVTENLKSNSVEGVLWHIMSADRRKRCLSQYHRVVGDYLLIVREGLVAW